MCLFKARSAACLTETEPAPHRPGIFQLGRGGFSKDILCIKNIC